MKTIAILQSNYIPWKGYFDIINLCDEFIIYDIVQYTKNDWRNRNLIYGEYGRKWLSIPIPKKGSIEKKINQIEIQDNNWIENHLNKIQNTYRKALHFQEVYPLIKEIYLKCEKFVKLSDINYTITTDLCRLLDINTLILKAEDFTLPIGKNEKLISICIQRKAQIYLSGKAAMTYINQDLFFDNNIKVKWMEYDHYPKYKQLNQEFNHFVSIIDLLMNTGIDDSRALFKESRKINGIK